MDSEYKGANSQDVDEAGATQETSPSTQSFSTEQVKEQWQQIVDKASELLSNLPDYLGEFFGEYKQPIITIGLIAGAVVSVKLTLAVLNAINDIPLLAPMFELIGLGYSVWFITRYMLKASDRAKLLEDFNALKEQILGASRLNG